MNLAENLDCWMSRLPNELQKLPIIYLAIPGTHDSMSYGIRKQSPLAPDAPNIALLNKIMPCVVRRWAITQSFNATEQLNCGIRYFDLRFCYKKSENTFYFVHGLYCEEITEPLKEIKRFLDNNPGEFVLFDCQHFYEFSDNDYEILTNIIIGIFGDKIYQTNVPLRDLTLEKAAILKKQILIIFRTNVLRPIQFWPSESWPSPWPNQTRVTLLRKYLDSSLTTRSCDNGYVSQCVLTPTMNYIVPRFFSTLRNTCAKNVENKLFDWIRNQRPGVFVNGEKPTCNVFIADFIDLQNSEFSKIVINLNSKLLINDTDSICSDKQKE